jgi:hypothetical protein
VYLLPGSRVISGGATQSSGGNVTIATDGNIGIYINFSNPAPNWSTSGANGFQNDWCVSYHIN